MDDVTQIRVGGHRTGIIGLKEALKSIANECRGFDDDQIAKEFVKRLSKRNYIQKDITNLYESAFLREYKKFIGEDVTEDDSGIINIKILGRGCPQCEKMDQEVMMVVAENKIAADVEHVRDVAEIGKYGVLGSPALVINGEVKVVGSVPPKTQMKEWILQTVHKIKY